MALLSNHLASLGYLSGAWTASKYGARLLQERGLHLSAKHGHGVDAEIRCRTFWCAGFALLAETLPMADHLALAGASSISTARSAASSASRSRSLCR